MVGSRQLARFVGEAERTGAKIVLVGDHEQLQAIGAGAPFRAIAERIGHAELSEIRRQRVDWQREASVAFATHRTGEGLAAYAEHGAIRFNEAREGARGDIVRDYLAHREHRPEGSRVAMAHRRADVRAINAEIRTALQERGELARGSVPSDSHGLSEGEGSGPGGDRRDLGRELTFQTNDGKRNFAAGDRIVFLQNDRELGVKNGMLGTVEAVEPHTIQVQLDGKARGSEDARNVTVSVKNYQAIDHGYATTIHKTQGATVDRGFVLASKTMDRHLTYVAMTRHRDGVQLYADGQEFKDAKALSATLGRARLKETTLDYTSEFAERRGMAEQLGVRSQIEIPREHARTERQAPRPRMEAEKADEDLGRVSRAQDLAQDRGDNPGGDRQRRSRFEGLKLGRSVATERSAQAQDRAETAQQRSEKVKKQVARKIGRGMFDGLQLKAPGSPIQRPEREGGLQRSTFAREAPEQDRANRERQAERLRPMSGFEQTVDRFARAWSAVERQDREGLPVLEGQKAELQKAGLELDQARTGAARLMVSAMQYDPESERAMHALSGRERVGQLVQGMDRERALQADPNVRADRLINRWQELQGQRQKLRGWQHDEARGHVESQMKGMAKKLERDPQVESILRKRSQELGISHIRQEQNIAREMARSLTRGQTLGLER